MAEEITIESTSENAPETAPVEGGAKLPEALDQRIEFHETAPDHADTRYAKILSKVTSSGGAVSDDDARTDAKSLSSLDDEEGKVRKLVDLAEVKGVEHAVRVARSLGDYYVLDRMHDELVDKLYESLVEKGLIEK